MEQNITSSSFRYWVKEVQPRPDVGDFVLMFGEGFQDDLENLAWGAPAGALLGVGENGKVISSLHLSPAHVPGRGDVTAVHGWTHELQTPFLLTDLLNTEFIGKFEGEIILSDWAKKVFNREYPGSEFPVETEDWFGILFLTQEGFAEERERVELLVFSEKPGARVKNGDRLKFTTWDKEPCGILVG